MGEMQKINCTGGEAEIVVLRIGWIRDEGSEASMSGTGPEAGGDRSS